jgi:hypothetical protein
VWEQGTRKDPTQVLSPFPSLGMGKEEERAGEVGLIVSYNKDKDSGKIS